MSTKIPMIKFSNGVEFQLFGLGTWESFHSTDALTFKPALEAALDAGYRHFDTAQVYGNEHIIGEFLDEKITSGQIKRSDIFITTKLAPLFYHPGAAEQAIQKSLENLKTEYIDLFLIHMPFGFEVECHILLPQNELFVFAKKLGITFTSYATLGSPGRPNKDPNDPNPTEVPLVLELSKKYKKTPSQILLRQMIQRGIAVIPKSTNPDRLQQNINIFDFELCEEDMAKFNEIKTKKWLFKSFWEMLKVTLNIRLMDIKIWQWYKRRID
uniref:NADP-dependent oxidoreductase domain-containing protein n=1 Tax=Acrobeloides nanus TaxID=290746 RepID=A0A914DFH2_9BILA